MVKDALDRNESSVTDAFGPVRSWNPVYFAFYPVGQAIRATGPERDSAEQGVIRRSIDGTEEVFSGAA